MKMNEAEMEKAAIEYVKAKYDIQNPRIKWSEPVEHIVCVEYETVSSDGELCTDRDEVEVWDDGCFHHRRHDPMDDFGGFDLNRGY
jgi:hypothetical protein